MSHVSALPSSEPKLDQSAVEVAQYALQAFSFSGVQDIDMMDAAVGVVGAAAVARLVYLTANHPSLIDTLHKMLSLLKRVKK